MKITKFSAAITEVRAFLVSGEVERTISFNSIRKVFTFYFLTRGALRGI